MSTMDEGAKQTARNAAQGISNPGGGDGNEFEMVKEVLLDTNAYLLGVRKQAPNFALLSPRNKCFMNMHSKDFLDVVVSCAASPKTFLIRSILT